jgi:two-component system chemotaxis response regulator CheY
MKKVIFVDDSNTVLLSVEKITKELVESGIIEFLTFDNPLEFLKKVENGLVYDLLILDINMPQINGLDLVEKLKLISNLKSIPIVAFSTETSKSIKKKGRDLGLVGWITKPFTNEKLLVGIKRILKIK